MDKLEEHYGVVLSESTIARITLGHAEKILESLPAQVWPSSPGESRTIIVETDGGMVPIVETDATQGDRRKGKKLCWREAKLSLAHVHGSKTLFFGGTLQGTVDAAGQCLFDCAIQAGFGAATRIHGVGDGAPWIADQVEKKFGAQGSYLIDFYHVCGYLSAAGKALTSTLEEQLAWLDLQKVRLKTQAVKDVFEALQPHIELATIADSDAPVRACYRYLLNRPEQLNYQDAIKSDLPIGSGEIESAHRYVVQQRLKRPGAWWQASSAERMLALRIHRANRLWNAYWQRNPGKQLDKVATSV